MTAWNHPSNMHDQTPSLKGLQAAAAAQAECPSQQLILLLTMGTPPAKLCCLT
jgi:hypothetical protein